VPHNRAIDNGGTEISFFFKNMYAEGGQILKSVMLKKLKIIVLSQEQVENIFCDISYPDEFVIQNR